MSTLTPDSMVSVPKTNSVLPPPMSITMNGGSPTAPDIAPAKDMAASSGPVRTTGRLATRARAGSVKSVRLAASRAAEVAATPTLSHRATAMASA